MGSSVEYPSELLAGQAHPWAHMAMPRKEDLMSHLVAIAFVDLQLGRPGR
jgi:hypothetical protein